jgi:hypothetical protein
MINSRITAELRRPAQFAGATQEIQDAMARYGNLTEISEHHEFDIEIPHTIAPDALPMLGISIIDTPDARVGKKTFFKLSAIGQPTDKLGLGKGPIHTLQRTAPDGSTYYMPILCDLLVELRSGDDKSTVAGYGIKNSVAARQVGMQQIPTMANPAESPLYQMLLRSCSASAFAPIPEMVNELRAHSIDKGFSKVRQYGRLDVRGRYFIGYSAVRTLGFEEDLSERKDILRETYNTTTFTRAPRGTRIDTKLLVSSLLNPHELGLAGANVEKVQQIFVQRTVLEIGSGKPAATETSTTMLDSIGILGPLLVAARAAANNRHIHYDRRKAA